MLTTNNSIFIILYHIVSITEVAMVKLLRDRKTTSLFLTIKNIQINLALHHRINPKIDLRYNDLQETMKLGKRIKMEVL